MGTDIIIYPVNDGKLTPPQVFPASEEPLDERCISARERAVANWVLKNNKHAGATTDTSSDARCLYLSIRKQQRLRRSRNRDRRKSPDSFETSILLSILGESALAMENQKNAKEKEEAAILAKNEQLRANLLRAISRSAHATHFHFRKRQQSYVKRGIF